MSTIIVKSLNKPNWAGMSRYKKCHDHVVAVENRKGYIIGLSKKEQRELESALGYEEGELAPHSEFWKEYAVTLTDRDLYLDLELAQDRLDYSLIKASPRIANSQNELANWPKAEYVVHDQEQDAEIENAKIDVEVSALATFAELSSAERRNYLKLLGKAVGSMSDSVVTNQLFKIAKNDPTNFNRITNLPDFKTRILLYDLIGAKIVTVKSGHYYFDDVILGHGEEAAARYLDDPQNQELKMALKDRVSRNKED